MMYFDGGCVPNPGEMEVCVVLNGTVHRQRNIGRGSNNQAEWLSLLWGLELAIQHGIRDINIRGDSLLVVNQAKGSWQCRDARLKEFLAEYHNLCRSFDRVQINHVYRHENLAGIELEKR